MANQNNIKPKFVSVHGQRGFNIYPNQKNVTVITAKPRAPYCSVENRYMYVAMRKLSHAAFKLYMYLCDNANLYNFGLSSRDIELCTGISGSTYDRAVKQLIEEGYLFPLKKFRHCETCKKASECAKDKLEKDLCENGYWFSPKPLHEIKDFHEYFWKCKETWEKGFEYHEGDYWDDQRTKAYDYEEYFSERQELQEELEVKPWATAKQEAFDLYDYLGIDENYDDDEWR